MHQDTLIVQLVFSFISPRLIHHSLLPDKKEDIAVPPAVVMPTPSKRGRKSKQMMSRVSGVLPPGSDALILAHLAAGGQVKFFVDGTVLYNDLSLPVSLMVFCCYYVTAPQFRPIRSVK